MAICKDCVHVEVCEDLTKAKLKAKLSPKRAEELLSVLREHGKTCEHFKDRSRFVELPFHLGDDVYCTRMFKIYKKTVKKIELDDDGLAIVTEDGYCIDSTICFRSQEEAEQALEEREANGQSQN